MTQERIEMAAIRLDGVTYSVPQPGRHRDVVRELLDCRRADAPVMGDEGFVTSRGRFVGRHEAMEPAVQAGQRLRRRPGGYQGDQLFSEDLW